MAQIASFSFAGTLDGNDPGKVVGVGVDAASLPNTASATNEDYFSVVRARALIEPVIYDAGYWKLRQISIGYDFAKFLKSSFLIKGLKLSAVAKNVLMLKKWADNYVPFAPHMVASFLGAMASCHVCASVPNFLILEWQIYFHTDPMFKEIVTFDGPMVENSFITLSEKPGVGVEINEEGMRKYAPKGVPFFE